MKLEEAGGGGCNEEVEDASIGIQQQRVDEASGGRPPSPSQPGVITMRPYGGSAGDASSDALCSVNIRASPVDSGSALTSGGADVVHHHGITSNVQQDVLVDAAGGMVSTAQPGASSLHPLHAAPSPILPSPPGQQTTLGAGGIPPSVTAPSSGGSEVELARRLGVRFDSSNAAWVARWVEPHSEKKKSRWFSVAKYGELAARRLAIQACLQNMKPSDFPSLRDLQDVLTSFARNPPTVVSGGHHHGSFSASHGLVSASAADLVGHGGLAIGPGGGTLDSMGGYDATNMAAAQYFHHPQFLNHPQHPAFAALHGVAPSAAMANYMAAAVAAMPPSLMAMASSPHHAAAVAAAAAAQMGGTFYQGVPQHQAAPGYCVPTPEEQQQQQQLGGHSRGDYIDQNGRSLSQNIVIKNPHNGDMTTEPTWDTHACPVTIAATVDGEAAVDPTTAGSDGVVPSTTNGAHNVDNSSGLQVLCKPPTLYDQTTTTASSTESPIAGLKAENSGSLLSGPNEGIIGATGGVMSAIAGTSSGLKQESEPSADHLNSNEMPTGPSEAATISNIMDNRGMVHPTPTVAEVFMGPNGIAGAQVGMQQHPSFLQPIPGTIFSSQSHDGVTVAPPHHYTSSGASSDLETRSGVSDEDEDEDDDLTSHDKEGSDYEPGESKRKKRKLSSSGTSIPSFMNLGQHMMQQPTGPSGFRMFNGTTTPLQGTGPSSAALHPSYYSIYPSFATTQHPLLHSQVNGNAGANLGNSPTTMPFLSQAAAYSLSLLPPHLHPAAAAGFIPHFQSPHLDMSGGAMGMYLPHGVHYQQQHPSPGSVAVPTTVDSPQSQTTTGSPTSGASPGDGPATGGSFGARGVGGSGGAGQSITAKMTCERGLHYTKNYRGSQECWIAVWNTKGGRIMHEAFDVAALGFEQAKLKAREARDAAHSNNIAVSENSRPSWKSHSNTGIPHVSLDSQQLRFRAHKFGRRLCRSFSFGRRRGSYATRESAFDAAVLWLIQTPTEDEIAAVSGVSSKLEDPL